jgi:hypothetical protein
MYLKLRGDWIQPTRLGAQQRMQGHGTQKGKDYPVFQLTSCFDVPVHRERQPSRSNLNHRGCKDG